MSEAAIQFDEWQRANEAYLAERLAWVRERLGGGAPVQSAPARKRPASKKVGARRTPKRNDSADDNGCVPALELLTSRLGLSPFERDVLLLCAAMEFDTRVPSLCAQAQGDPHRAYPTFAVAMTLLDEPAWDAMSPHRPLRRLRLVEINQPAATPLTAAALRADERVVNFIKGLNYLDDRLTPLLTSLDSDDGVELPESQQAVVDMVTAELGQIRNAALLPVIELVGSDGASKQSIATRIAASVGLNLHQLPAELVPSDFTDFESLLRLWEREQLLLPIALYLDAREIDAAALSQSSSPLNRLIARIEGLVFLDLPEQRVFPGRQAIFADVTKPTPLEQRGLWTELTGDAESAAQLSGQFSFNAADIRRLASKAPGDGDALWASCCRASRPQLDSLAHRIDAKATWDDLVLPEEPLSLLREITGQVRHRSRVYDDWGFRARCNRGLGISVLFAGESGTGKTMAAEVIANDLKLDLYRIDLSAVVNKYIGETEKNLKRLFDAADDGGAILLFDEADALFGKRTEVKDSHDRYANLEVNYLLQRMEAYRGLAILATNMKGSLDHAFLRRLRFVVDFPTPERLQRIELWSKSLIAASPNSNVDVDSLAALPVNGGNIQSVALNAAFMAACDNSEVNHLQVCAAARNELRKLQKPLSSAGFRAKGTYQT